MPPNKKHHYVPRFYLKRFSESGKDICIYNLDQNKKIPNANLKNQCYKDYFYGKDDYLEKALGDLETGTSLLLREVDKSGYFIPFSEEHLLVIVFILAQYGRTKHTVDMLDEMNDKLTKQVFGEMLKNDFKKSTGNNLDLNSIKIGLNSPSNYSVSQHTSFYPLLIDLGYKILINNTDTEFVTSDNPVVVYNKFFLYRKHSSDIGFGSKGLIICLPISPSKLIMFYDKDVYRLGSDSKLTIELTKSSDIYNLNTLQVCSSYKNIYFKDEDFDSFSLHKKARPYIINVEDKVSVQSFPGESSKKRKTELIGLSRKGIKFNLQLSILSIRKSAKKWLRGFRKQKSTPVIVMRNETLYNDYTKFQGKVEKNIYKPDEFFIFLKDKENK